jgi:hypothetical protein
LGGRRARERGHFLFYSLSCFYFQRKALIPVPTFVHYGEPSQSFVKFNHSDILARTREVPAQNFQMAVHIKLEVVFAFQQIDHIIMVLNRSQVAHLPRLHHCLPESHDFSRVGTISSPLACQRRLITRESSCASCWRLYGLATTPRNKGSFLPL